MAWNDDPMVRDLGEYAKKYGLRIAVVFGLGTDAKERYRLISYGANAQLCEAASKIADELQVAIQKGAE